jgi:hypothetical protein
MGVGWGVRNSNALAVRNVVDSSKKKQEKQE